MFRRRSEAGGTPVTFTFEGETVEARAGDSVAAAIAVAGGWPTRTTPVSGAPRAPYCMMGVCFDCLMVIDGEPDRQACMVEVRQDMDVRRQQGAAALPLASRE
ncbi:MAG: (2Fe-2S)-binding protein [Acetobacterales bacterium]